MPNNDAAAAHTTPSTSQHLTHKKSILKSVLNPSTGEAPKAELDPTPHARATTTPMSDREKRSILRELKARVDSFDEELRTTNRYYEQQQAVVYDAPLNKKFVRIKFSLSRKNFSIEKAIEMDINRVRRKSSMGVSAPNVKTLPNHLINNCSPQKRANSVSGHDPTSSLGGTRY